MVEKENNKNMKKCPRFLTCSVPICPGDVCWSDKVFIKGDKKCKMPKNELKKLGFSLQVKARTEAGKSQHLNWLQQQGKSVVNLKKFEKSHVNGRDNS